LHDLDKGLRDADVVMALRIQHERMDSVENMSGTGEYFANFGISRERMQLAAPDAIVMHPGPMNRGVEIESGLADSPQSVITQQVTNGVAVRMAVLSMVGQNMNTA
jgi:aspartate carbamoyltransferase catalytic subunit